MADKLAKPVFGRQTEVLTARPVPDPGSDNHVDLSWSDGAWGGGANRAFFRNLSGEQDLIRTASYVVQTHKDQIVRIEQAQRTTAREEITITSTEDQVYVKAATQLVLEVGESKITMTSDGRIEIAGVEITITGDVVLSYAAQQNTIIGGRVDINPPA